MEHYLSRLQSQMAAHWDKLALCDYGKKGITFGELAKEIARLHLLFEQLGIQKGDKVAISARNQARWAVTFLALNTYEAVAVPILADFTPDNICRLVTHSEAVVLFTDPDMWQKLSIEQMPLTKRVLSVADASPLYMQPGDEETFSALDRLFTEKYPHGFSIADVNYPTNNDKELVVINYTSGTSSDPKGVMLRYECFSANTAYGQKMCPSTPDDSLLSILPMAHMFGMAFELIYPLCGGGTAVYFLGRTPSPSVLTAAMQKVQPYMFIAVPMVFEKIYFKKLKPVAEKPAMKVLLHIPGIKNILYSKMCKAVNESFGGKVRYYIMGGAAVNPEVEKFFRAMKLQFTVGYGMTEAAPLLAYSDWREFKLRSCGKAMDFVSLRIDSEDPVTVPGEIQAKGLNIFSGYYKNDEATRNSFTPDGWFNTGDIGTIDEAGNVYIKGRSKSMILSSNGQNIYPEEIETIINVQPYVAESLAVGRGDKVVALVYLDPDAVKEANLTAEDQSDLSEVILRNVNAVLPKYSQLAQVEIKAEPFLKTPKMSIKRYLYK
ncbi:MAG: AMP-binding protein [Bacteroidaceae bacterium]|nr:AMP-binding protein [Bacteroidaceae bacterium]